MCGDCGRDVSHAPMAAGECAPPPHEPGVTTRTSTSTHFALPFRDCRKTSLMARSIFELSLADVAYLARKEDIKMAAAAAAVAAGGFSGHAWPQSYDHIPSHPYNAGRGEVF